MVMVIARLLRGQYHRLASCQGKLTEIEDDPLDTNLL
jgi:hypothetical protein